MINNCPTIPEYVIDSCFVELQLQFMFTYEADYTIKITDNIGNVTKIDATPISTNAILIPAMPALDIIYSPFIFEVYDANSCFPKSLFHCGDLEATQFIVHIQNVSGDINANPRIPCCVDLSPTI